MLFVEQNCAQPDRHAVGAEFCRLPVRAVTGRREDEEEIDRAARAMLANHGANAAQEAQRRANNLLQCGVESQADRWRQIALAICKIEAGRREGERQVPVGTRPRQNSNA
jgi:hypothetical protein